MEVDKGFFCIGCRAVSEKNGHEYKKQKSGVLFGASLFCCVNTECSLSYCDKCHSFLNRDKTVTFVYTAVIRGYNNEPILGAVFGSCLNCVNDRFCLCFFVGKRFRVIRVRKTEAGVMSRVVGILKYRENKIRAIGSCNVRTGVCKGSVVVFRVGEGHVKSFFRAILVFESVSAVVGVKMTVP